MDQEKTTEALDRDGFAVFERCVPELCCAFSRKKSANFPARPAGALGSREMVTRVCLAYFVAAEISEASAIK